MDIVIPYKHHPGDFALRYALRSLSGQKVIIVGHRPYWVKNVLHIPCGDKEGPQHKEANIFRKLIKSCQDERVSDPFIYSMNDVFFLHPPTNEDYYQGTLQDKIDRIGATGTVNNYLKTMRQTLSLLHKQGLPTLHYDIHGPTVIHKDKLLALRKYDWSVPYGYGIRSMYGNMNSVDAVSIADCKIDRPCSLDHMKEVTEGRRFFSIEDKVRARIFPALEYFLQELFPNVSEFELT